MHMSDPMFVVSMFVVSALNKRLFLFVYVCLFVLSFSSTFFVASPGGYLNPFYSVPDGVSGPATPGIFSLSLV